MVGVVTKIEGIRRVNPSFI